MISDPKTLVDMGCNVAIMTSFAIPVVGPEIAAGIAAGQMVFDLFFQIPDRTDPAAIAPTHADLTNAIIELKQFIADASFNTLLSSYQASVMTINDQLGDVWSNVSTGDAIKDRARRGPLFQATASTAQLDSWRIEIDGYKATILGSNPDLLQVINWIEGDVTHSHRTLGLYTLVGGLWVNYCNLNIGFEFILAMHDYAVASSKYNDDMIDYNTAHNVWKLSGKALGKPEPLAPVAPISPIMDENFLNGSVFADKAKKYVDRFIAYVEPKVKLMRSDSTSRAQDLQTRLDAIVLVQDANGWHYTDNQTGHSSGWVSYRAVADAQMKVYKGSVEASLWNRLTTQYGLAGIEDADIATLEATLVEWKKASAIFAPK